MDKFKIELTWHNCKTCPPQEDFNPWLLITNGKGVDNCSYHKNYGFPISAESMDKFWWADLSRTMREWSQSHENENK